MNITQDHITIKEIGDDMIFLKDGGGALVLAVSAVNFGLLSEREQFSIIESFANLLNSLSFSIQIVIYSKRLNISSYVAALDKAQKAQTNPLLFKMMTSYRQFIQALIKENEVLDKKFYVVIPLYKLELGLISSKEKLEQKIKTVLLPRRDQVVKQLQRVGLKAQQLTSEKLIELFYEMYNASEVSVEDIQSQRAKIIPTTAPQKATIPPPPPIMQPSQSKAHPFVVEELEEG